MRYDALDVTLSHRLSFIAHNLILSCHESDILYLLKMFGCENFSTRTYLSYDLVNIVFR